MANFGYYPVAGTDEVVRGGGALTGVAPSSADWGYDPATGKAYYKNAAGNWTEFIAGAQEVYRFVSPATTPATPQDPTKPAVAVNGDTNILTHYWDPTSSSWKALVSGSVRKYRAMQNLVAGNNIITHNLNLTDTAVMTDVRNNTTGATIAHRVVAETANNTTIWVAAAVTSAKVTIMG